MPNAPGFSGAREIGDFPAFTRAAEPRGDGRFSVFALRVRTARFAMTLMILPLAALGWSLLYLLFGGGLLGAVVIFVLLKAFKK